MIYMVHFNDPLIANLSREFDKIFAQSVKGNYPPYNVIHFDKTNDYILEFAVAGFTKENLSLIHI
jgi:HSP20 family molecular chaperone IbpA